jgi:hypothetical protein
MQPNTHHWIVCRDRNRPAREARHQGIRCKKQGITSAGRSRQNGFMTQIAANVFKRIHLIIIRASTGGEGITQGAIATRHFDEHWRLFGANVVTQVIGDALHARPIILEALAGLTASRAG